LTFAARLRVVFELSAVHPQSSLSPLWRKFWNLPRPTRPTARDAEAVIREVVGVRPAVRRWRRAWSFMGERGPSTVDWIRRRLCLTVESDTDVSGLLVPLRDLVPCSGFHFSL